MAESDLKDEILRKFEAAKPSHDAFVRRYERNERVYRGVKQRVAQRDKWRHTLRPNYGFNLLETVVSSMSEMGLRFSARPSPMVALTADQAQAMLLMSNDVEDLVRHEHRVDGMDQKQRPLFLCDGIGGRAPWKTYWNYVPGITKRQGVQETVIHGPNDEILGTVPTIVEIEEQGVLRDHSTTEVVDPRDFILHESAQHLDPWKPGGAQHLFHRCWYSYDQLKYLESIGFVQNIEKLKDCQNLAASEYNTRDNEVFDIQRTKDLIEVLEFWKFEDGKIKSSWLGGRREIIKPEADNPFWHGAYPFGMVSAMPYPFSATGISTIELVADILEIIWELGNQRLDNVELINNAIMLIRGDVEDPDAFEHYPGARWEVDDPSQVEPLMPPYQVAQVSIESENLLRGDLQNITSAVPFASGAQTSSVEQNTATGASIVMNAAQQQLAAKKHQAQFGLVQEANMRLKNCQQFYDGEKLVHILGPEGATVFKKISILAIQGDYLLELDAMNESQMRQERRAEASNFAQLMVGFAPLAAAAGEPLSIPAIVKWFCKKWDIEAPEQFFAHPANQGAPGAMEGLGGQGGGGGGAPGAPAPPGGPNLGVTSGTAVDASKPSATGGLSMSPQLFLQRAAALAGGQRGGG